MSPLNASMLRPGLSVRLTQDPDEIAKANRIIFKNYVAAGFWMNNAKQLDNQFLRAASRRVVVAVDRNEVIGTISLLFDSEIGLPSDGPLPHVLKQLRDSGDRFAEISGFAVERSYSQHRSVAIALLSYALQYSLYYTTLDRVIASCTVAHSAFYISSLGCTSLSGPTHYPTAPNAGEFHLLTLDLNATYSAAAIDASRLRHQLLLEPHGWHRFPDALSTRPRQVSVIRQEDVA